jgi:hypothetical protein
MVSLWRTAGCLALALSVGQAAQAPALADLLRLGSEYVAAYTAKTSGVTLEEYYTLIELNGDRMMVPVRIGSDLTFVNMNGKLILLRDVYAVDTKATRERTPRITALLSEPTTAKWVQAQKLPGEGQYLFRNELIYSLSEPTMSLQFLAAAKQPKLTYKIDGKKKMNGVELIGLRFSETKGRDTKYTLRTRGNASISGRFWMDPATGAVHHVEYAVTSEVESVVSSVKFARDAALGLLLPAEVSETYDLRELPSGPSNLGVGGYGAKQAFQTRAQYSNARYTPIDLGKITR